MLARAQLLEQRVVEFAFGWKVLEHQGVAGADLFGNILYPGGAKALLREQINGLAYDQFPAIFRG